MSSSQAILSRARILTRRSHARRYLDAHSRRSEGVDVELRILGLIILLSVATWLVFLLAERLQARR